MPQASTRPLETARRPYASVWLRALGKESEKPPRIVHENLANGRLLDARVAELWHEDRRDGRVAGAPGALQALLMSEVGGEQDRVFESGLDERHHHLDLHRVGRLRALEHLVADGIETDEHAPPRYGLVGFRPRVVQDVGHVPDAKILGID